VPLRVAAELAAAVGQHAQQLDLVLLEERQHPVYYITRSTSRDPFWRPGDDSKNCACGRPRSGAGQIRLGAIDRPKRQDPINAGGVQCIARQIAGRAKASLANEDVSPISYGPYVGNCAGGPSS
jgi:hypothetical protein